MPWWYAFHALMVCFSRSIHLWNKMLADFVLDIFARSLRSSGEAICVPMLAEARRGPPSVITLKHAPQRGPPGPFSRVLIKTFLFRWTFQWQFTFLIVLRFCYFSLLSPLEALAFAARIKISLSCSSFRCFSIWSSCSKNLSCARTSLACSYLSSSWKIG